MQAWVRHVAAMFDNADRETDTLSDQAARVLGAKRIWTSWAWVLVILALAHVVAAGLYAAGRATFQGIPPSLLDDLSNNPAWVAAHLAAAVGLVVSITRGPASRSWACNVSSAFLASWSLLLLMVGLSVERGVSLLGPAFGIVIAIAAQVSAQKYFAESVVKEAARQAQTQPNEEA